MKKHYNQSIFNMWGGEKNKGKKGVKKRKHT